MAAKGESEGFVSPLDWQGARHKDSYYPMSDENTAELRDMDAEFETVKSWFPADCTQQTSERFVTEWILKKLFAAQRRSTNLPKFKIATFYSPDVELWFN